MADAPHPPTPDLLTAVPVVRSTVGQLAGISCGDTPAGRDASDWISDLGWPTVTTELRRGTRVWAYRNAAGAWVGFSSMRIDWWMLDRPPQRLAVHYLPMLAIFGEHQGRPELTAGTPRYCYQVLAHLRAEAIAGLAATPLVGLSVRSDNAEAIHVYERVGFVRVEQGKLNRMLMRLQ